jgi:hypothetical protein
MVAQQKRKALGAGRGGGRRYGRWLDHPGNICLCGKHCTRGCKRNRGAYERRRRPGTQACQRDCRLSAGPFELNWGSRARRLERDDGVHAAPDGSCARQVPARFAGTAACARLRRVGLGALLAASMPRTRQEDELMGRASDEVKERIGDARREQLQRVSEAANEAANAQSRSDGDSSRRAGDGPTG